MRNRRWIVALGVSLVALGQAEASAQQGAQQPSGTVAFVNVTVVPMDRDRLIEGQTVVVRDGRIAALGPSASTRAPAGATVVEARGKFLMPGLAEMHAHIPPAQAPPQFTENVLFLYVANGITTIRGMLGEPSHLQLRDRAARGELLSPRIYTSGPSLNGNSVPAPDSARRVVIAQKGAGYDFLKVHPGLTREVFDAIDRTADSVGMTFGGHVSVGVGLRRTLDAKQATVDHLDGYVEALVADSARALAASSQFFGLNLIPHVDETKMAALATATRAAGVWNVPTMSLFEDWVLAGDSASMMSRPELRYMPRAMVAQWLTTTRNFQGNPNYSRERAREFLTIRRQILRSLRDAGAGLLLGSDAPQIFNVPGYSMHEELRAMAGAGLTPFEALSAGTRNVAIFFGAENERGTVAMGKVADLILLDANPLADVANVQRRAGVMVRGRWLPESEIQQRLAAIAAAYR
ncbi:MAG: amidohydrolase family protein [Gemmatimonadaceae bacterium]